MCDNNRLRMRLMPDWFLLCANAVLADDAALWREPGQCGRCLRGKLASELLPSKDHRKRGDLPNTAALSLLCRSCLEREESTPLYR